MTDGDSGGLAPTPRALRKRRKARRVRDSEEAGAGTGPAEAQRPTALADSEGVEITPDELREFIAADLAPSEARPEFKDGLRHRLRRLLERRRRRDAGATGDDPER